MAAQGRSVEVADLSHRRLYEDYAAIAQRRGGALAATVLRTRSRQAVDLLAWMATGGRMDFAQLAGAIEPSGALHAASLTPMMLNLDAYWMSRLGRVLLLGHSLHPDAKEIGLTLLDLSFLAHRGAGLKGDEARAYAHGLFRSKRYSDLRVVIDQLAMEPFDTRAVKTDLLNPTVTPGSDPGIWAGHLAGLMGHQEPGFSLRATIDGTQPLLDQLDRSTTIHAGTVDGPLVTVMVPAYRPGPSLLTSVRSLLNQTWGNLEIIVVDDGTPEREAGVFEHAAELDHRIKYVRCEDNRGTYRVRNLALSLANGRLATGQDADDWSDPRRIEVQARALLDRREVVATRSRSLRVSPNMVTTYIGETSSRPNASSLMIDREKVLAGVGFFDPVRKAADTEYVRRLKVRFGTHSVRDVPEQIHALVRLEEASLSRSDFAPGWHREERDAYVNLFSRWHDRIRSGEEDGFIESESETRARAFPAPKYIAEKGLIDQGDLDVVFLGDWRAYGGPQKSMIEEIRAAKAAGLRVGLAHAEALRFMRSGREYLSAPARDLILDGTVEWLHFRSYARVRLLICRYPPIFQFDVVEKCNWQVSELWMVANQAPANADGSDVRYIPVDVARNLSASFQSRVVWVPQGPIVRRTLIRHAADIDLDPRDSPGILDADEWHECHRIDPNRAPVVGRYSRDEPVKFPDTADAMVDVYGDPRLDVRMLGAVRTVPTLFEGRPIPANWRLLKYGAVDTKEFLSGVDYFAYYHHSVLLESFGRSILEAIAAGVVVILPPHFMEVFHVGAVYSKPNDVADTIVGIHQDPAQYRRLVDRAREYVKDFHSYESFQARILQSSALSGLVSSAGTSA